MSTILSSTILSEACNALTLSEAAIQASKNINKVKYIYNQCKPALKIAVFGSSGSGKSSFLNRLIGNHYDGESTRSTEVIKFKLPNGRRIHFYDCPGQPIYGTERTDIKTKILNGQFHAIINVVCFGYNETQTSQVKIFDGNGQIRQNYLQDNLDIELRQLSEWTPDITHTSKIKWILTVINKKDIWNSNQKDVIDYYTEGKYGKVLEGFKKACSVDVIGYCSRISPFGNRPMWLEFSDKDKIKCHLELLGIIHHNIEKS